MDESTTSFYMVDIENYINIAKNIFNNRINKTKKVMLCY